MVVARTPGWKAVNSLRELTAFQPTRTLQAGDGLDLQRLLLVAALDDDRDGWAGLDEAGGGESVVPAVGPAAVEGQQAVALFQARLRHRAARNHLRHRHPGI